VNADDEGCFEESLRAGKSIVGDGRKGGVLGYQTAHEIPNLNATISQPSRY
jgi:hypothetical protein